MQKAAAAVKGFNNVSKEVGITQAATARGATTLGRGFLYAAGAAGPLNSELGVLASSSTSVGVATAGAAIGVGALALGLKSSISAAIDFESSFAGIKKTIDATDAEFKQLADANRQMARELPIGVNEINKIGEAAGALGITGVTNIESFERTIAQLSITTNLTADEAASAFGHIRAALDLPTTSLSNLASAIVDLGNKGASTETEIVAFLEQIAGSGKLLGLTAAQLAGISSAFASLGLDAEAGGSAIQRVFLALIDAAAKGGDELKVFAATTGETVDNFQALIRTNPAQAFIEFVQGLKAAGDQAIPVLDALGLSDVRLERAFLTAAGAGSLLTDQINIGTKAYQENTAATDETNKRLDTFAAQLAITKNKLNDIAISLGDKLLPAATLLLQAINGLIGGIESLGAAFSNAGTLIQITTIIIAGLLGPITGVIGAVGTLGVEWDGVWGDIKTATETAVNAILTAITKMVNGLGLGIEKLNGLVDAIPGASAALGKLGIDLDAINTALQNFDAGRISLTGSSKTEPRVLGSREDRASPGAVGALAPAVNTDNEALKGLLDSLGKTGKAAGGAADALTPLSAVMDGIITQSEAAALGLTDQQVVTLELAKASADAAEEDFRRRIGLQELAAVFPGLTAQEVQFRLGLKAIQDHLRETGETIEQFILDTSTSALEGFKSAFDAIFNKPTKESAQLQLQLDELKRKKLLNQSGDTKSIDADIARVQRLIDIRENQLDIERDHAQIAEAQNFSDRDQLTQLNLLTTAIGITAGQVEQMGGVVYLQFTNLGNAANEAADALRSIGPGGVQGSFASGIDYVPRDMVARIHKGERIIPANQVGESGQPINITSYITVEGDATERTVEMIKRAVRDESEAALRRAAFRGNYVTSGAYTPS